MDCAQVASIIVSYHFGSSSSEERDEVDAHLLLCTSCLKTYLSLKRAADARPLERPADDARKRLRAEVARSFTREAALPPSIFSRRIPLYQGVVAAAIAAAIALAVPRLVESQTRLETGQGTFFVDTSRAGAQSLGIY